MTDQYSITPRRGFARVSRACSSHAASSSILCLSRATSVGSRDAPRSNIAAMSALGLGSPRSLASSRRTYSANVMPSSAALACARRCSSGSIVICVRAFMMATSCHHGAGQASRGAERAGIARIEAPSAEIRYGPSPDFADAQSGLRLLDGLCRATPIS